METDKMKTFFVIEEGNVLCFSLGERNGRWYEARVLGNTGYGHSTIVRVVGSSDGSRDFEKWPPHYNSMIEIPEQYVKKFKRG